MGRKGRKAEYSGADTARSPGGWVGVETVKGKSMVLAGLSLVYTDRGLNLC